MNENTETTETTETTTTESTTETTETVETPVTETTTETTTEEVKTEEVEKPIEYEPFTMAEGLTLDENLANVFKPVFAEMKLDQAAAQKLVDLYSTEVVKKQIDGWNTMLASWDEAAKKDPEIGGTKYDASVKSAELAFNSFEVPEARELLVQYGLHKNPAIIKLFSRIGAKMAEPTTIVTGKTESTGDVLAQMYPSTQKK